MTGVLRLPSFCLRISIKSLSFCEPSAQQAPFRSVTATRHAARSLFCTRDSLGGAGAPGRNDLINLFCTFRIITKIQIWCLHFNTVIIVIILKQRKMDSNESIAVKHYYIKNIIHQPPMSYSPTSICDHIVVAGIYI